MRNYRGKRNTAVYQQAQELYLQGKSYREIGDALGVTRQRAQQMIRPPIGIYRLVQQRAKGCCQVCGISVRSGHVHHVGAIGRTLDDLNDIENLKYLCPTCHREEHGREVRANAPQEFTVPAILLPECKCVECGYVWVPRVSVPKVCPYCKKVLDKVS